MQTIAMGPKLRISQLLNSQSQVKRFSNNLVLIFCFSFVSKIFRLRKLISVRAVAWRPGTTHASPTRLDVTTRTGKPQVLP